MQLHYAAEVNIWFSKGENQRKIYRNDIICTVLQTGGWDGRCMWHVVLGEKLHPYILVQKPERRTHVFRSKYVTELS